MKGLSLLVFYVLLWRTDAKTNIDLISELKRNGFIKSVQVARVMLIVDREKYCPKALYPYDDIPRDIGFSATISAPQIHAQVLELLKGHLTQGMTALDIGSGSGYLTACMAIMLGESGLAIGVDHIPELVIEATNNIQKHRPLLLKSGRIRLYAGDGRIGFPKHAPYDAINIGGSIPKIPQKILDQLRNGGRIVAVLGRGEDQYLTVVDKNENGWITAKRIRRIILPPLMDKEEQMSLNITKTLW